MGVPTLKEFHQRVKAVETDETPAPSYASVRTYHFDRDPPVSYLVLVSRAFEVSLRYLAEGVGEPKEPKPLGEQARTREQWRAAEGEAAAYAPNWVVQEDREELRRMFGTNPVLYLLVGLPPSAINGLQELAYQRERSLGGLASELLTRAIEEAGGRGGGS